LKTGAETNDWSEFLAACSGATALVDSFPERPRDFQVLIVDLIQVVKDKTENVRKVAAVLLAKLAKDEENSKHMRAHHGHEVLMSLRTAL